MKPTITPLRTVSAAMLAGACVIASVDAGAADAGFEQEAAPPIPGYAPSTDPHDFSGLWRSKPAPGSFLPFVLAGQLPFTESAQARVNHALEMSAKNTQLATPHIMCRPTGVNQAFGPIAPVYVLQNAEKMAFIVMDEIRDIRQVYFADAHPADLEPSYGGHSIAHWDGNTLIVDAIGYNGRGVLNNAVHSDAMGDHEERGRADALARNHAGRSRDLHAAGNDQARMGVGERPAAAGVRLRGKSARRQLLRHGVRRGILAARVHPARGQGRRTFAGRVREAGVDSLLRDRTDPWRSPARNSPYP
jgi:hypothetical protein